MTSVLGLNGITRSFALFLCLLLPACCLVVPSTPPGQHRPSSGRAQTEGKGQQHYYDIGLRHYAKDDYQEAKEAFERVVELGPNTPLGQKAQKNLRKIQQIQKTLKDIESK